MRQLTVSQTFTGWMEYIFSSNISNYALKSSRSVPAAVNSSIVVSQPLIPICHVLV